MTDTPPALGARLSRLRVRHLQLLDQIDRCGSLSTAAAAVGVSQPRATLMLREVEEAVGRPLLQRSPRGGSLNAAGRIALHRLRVALGALDALALSMKGAEPQPVVRIGVAPLVGSDALCTVLADLQSEGALPQIVLRVGTVGELLSQLAAGDVDCVLSSLDSGAASQRVDSHLRITRLWEEHFFVIAAKDHPILRKRRVTLEEALRHPWVEMSHKSANRQAFERMFLAAGYPSPPPTVETESPHMALALVSRSRMLALMPDSAYRLAADRVGRVRLDYAFAPTWINLITWGDPPALPIVDELTQRLRRLAQRLTKP